MTELVSQAEYARHRGVSRKSVTAWKKAGRLVWQDGKIDRDASDAELDGRGQNGKKRADEGNDAEPDGNTGGAPATGNNDGPEPAPAGSGLRQLIDHLDLLTKHEAEKVKENYLALQRRLEYEREAGQLVRIDDVEREHADRCQRIRSQVMALPNEVAAGIAQEIGGDANEVRSIVQDKVNDVLEELAHGRGGSS